MKAAVPENVALRLRIAGYEFFFKVELTDQVPHRCRKSRTLRTCFEYKSVSSYRGDHAAGAWGRFQYDRLNAQLPQAERASEAADSAADDHCFVYVPHNL